MYIQDVDEDTRARTVHTRPLGLELELAQRSLALVAAYPLASYGRRAHDDDEVEGTRRRMRMPRGTARHGTTRRDATACLALLPDDERTSLGPR